MPLQPGKEALYKPSAFIAPQFPAILRIGFAPIASMRSYHINSLLTKVIIQIIAVVGFIPNQFLRLCFYHVKIKGQLNQRDLVMIRRMGADCKGKPIAVNDSHDLYSFASLGFADTVSATFSRSKCCIDKAFSLINVALITKRIGKFCQNGTQNFASAPLLKTTMHGLVIWKTLREHVPLSTGVQYPQYGFQNCLGRYWLSASPSIRNILFRKVFPYHFPLVVAQLHTS